MINHIVRLSSLLIGVALLLTGHGLQLALVPVRTQLLGWSSIDVGYLTSLYFLGFISGCFLVPQLVARIGHIRAFASLTAAATAVILMFSLTNYFVVWLLLRFVIGVAIVGLYLVIESWLNSQVSNEVRGSMLAAYTVIVLCGLAAGQLLLNLAPPETPQLFIIAAILIVLASLPVLLTRSSQPAAIPSARFSPRLVFKTSKAAVLGSFLGGLVAGSFYGLGPVYGLQIGLALPAVSLMMALGILGGACLQLPLGRLSDRMDRRKVILGATCMGTLVAVGALSAPPVWIPWVMFCFGASIMPVYAISLAHASDFSESDNFLEIGTGLLMINGVGSVIGPLVTAPLMDQFGADMFFISHISVLALGSLLLVIIIAMRERRAVSFSEFTLATTAAAQGAIQMDPRSEDHGEEDFMEPLPEEEIPAHLDNEAPPDINKEVAADLDK